MKQFKVVFVVILSALSGCGSSQFSSAKSSRNGLSAPVPTENSSDQLGTTIGKGTVAGDQQGGTTEQTGVGSQTEGPSVQQGACHQKLLVPGDSSASAKDGSASADATAQGSMTATNASAKQVINADGSMHTESQACAISVSSGGDTIATTSAKTIVK